MLSYQTNSVFLSSSGKKGGIKLLRRINAKMKPDNLFSLMIAFSVRLTGTKYGCGGGGCGACTVMISTYEPASKKIRYP